MRYYRTQKRTPSSLHTTHTKSMSLDNANEYTGFMWIRLLASNIHIPLRLSVKVPVLICIDPKTQKKPFRLYTANQRQEHLSKSKLTFSYRPANPSLHIGTFPFLPVQFFWTQQIQELQAEQANRKITSTWTSQKLCTLEFIRLEEGVGGVFTKWTKWTLRYIPHTKHIHNKYIYTYIFACKD